MVTRDIISTEEERVNEIILHKIETRMNKLIVVGLFGTMRSTDKAT